MRAQMLLYSGTLACAFLIWGCQPIGYLEDDDRRPGDDDGDDDDTSGDPADDDTADDDTADDDTADDDTTEVDGDGDGFTVADGDCDDGDPGVYPDAPELPDGIDQDCNGLVDDGTGLYDDDGDGFREADGDCDDGDPTIHPLAEEVCDGVDQDCDGTIDDRDADGDGFLAAECGFDDCDDGDPTVHPGAPELAHDGLDSDCDGAENPSVGNFCYSDQNVISVPDIVDYSLSAAYDAVGGPLGPDHYFDDIEFEALAGSSVVVAMSSYYAAPDPVLLLLDSYCNVVAQDDNGWGGDNAFVDYAVPVDDVYTIIATSALPLETGYYTLQIGERTDPGFRCLHDFWTATCGAANTNFGLSAGDAEDGPRGAGYYYDDVEFEGIGGATVTVTMDSWDFDTYLYLLDQDCHVLVENDDRDGLTSNSGISVQLPADGAYTMVFTSKHPFSGPAAATGSFDWEIDCAP